jgi:hypothetical protein
MERRRFLSWLATVSAGGLAGYSGTPAEGSQDSSTPVPVDTETPSTPGLAAGDVELPVPKHRLELAGFRDSIPAITDPAYAEDWRRSGSDSNAKRSPRSSISSSNRG